MRQMSHNQNRDWLTSNWLFAETFMDPFKELQRDECTYFYILHLLVFPVLTNIGNFNKRVLFLSWATLPSRIGRRTWSKLGEHSSFLLKTSARWLTLFWAFMATVDKVITYLPGEHGPDWLKMGEHPTKCRALRKIHVTILTNLCLVCFGNFHKMGSTQRQKI